MKHLISSYKVVGDKLYVTTPYAEHVIKTCRSWAGKFEGGAWVVAATRLPEVQKLLGKNLEDLVQVEVTDDHFRDSDAQLRVGWYILAGRRGRDSRAEVYGELVKGSIPASGGSVKYPSVNQSDDAAFRLWVPRDFAADHLLPIVADEGGPPKSQSQVEELMAFVQKVASLTVLSKLNLTEEALALSDEAKSLWLKYQNEHA